MNKRKDGSISSSIDSSKSTNSEEEHVEELFDEDDFNFELEENEDLKQIDDDNFDICHEDNDNGHVPFTSTLVEGMLQDKEYKVHQCEEDLMILLKHHSLAPSIFNKVMQWAKSSLPSGYNFNSPRYKTVMKNMCVRFNDAAGGTSLRNRVHVDNHQPTPICQFNVIDQIRCIYSTAILQ